MGTIFQYDITSSTYAKQVDLDSTTGGNPGFGHLVEYKTESAVNDLSDNGFSLYPNPTDGLIHLQFAKPGEITSVEIRDAVGRIMFSGNTNATGFTGQIDLSGYANGIYLLSIRSANAGTVTKQLVKN